MSMVKEAHTAKLGLDVETTDGVVNIFKTVLADESVLYTKLRNYHWNVAGRMFHGLHITFEEQYTTLAATIDEIAERIRTYGAKSPGTMAEFLELARLDEEQKSTYPAAEQMIANLVADHEIMIRNLREDIEVLDDLDDVGAEDFLTGLLQTHQTQAWMLRAMIES